MWDFGIFNNFQKFQVCGNIISAQISQKKNDRLKSADFGTLIYERTHIKYNCVACQVSYVGSTSRNLFIRVAEHMGRSPYTNSKMDQPKFSAIREHCKPECSISPDNFKILAMGNNEWELPTLESIYIKLKAPTLNTTELFLKIF